MRTTLMFALRWKFVPFFGGLVAVIMATYGIWTWQPAPPDLPFQSLSGMYGYTLYWIVLLYGLVSVVMAWRGAAKLRRGE